MAPSQASQGGSPMTADPSRPEALAALLDQPEPDRPALITGEDGSVVSYGQLAGRVDALAGRLAAAGVERGDRVALSLPNGPEFVQVLLAITALGAAAAPLNPAYTDSELTFYLTDIGPRFFLLPASRPAAAVSAAGACSIAVLTVEPSGDGPPGLFAAQEVVSATSYP